MLDTLSIWTEQYAGALVFIIVLSFVLLLATLLATPYLLARIPENYFSLTPAHTPRTPLKFLIASLRTLLGLLLIMTGILMFFTPGPGLVMLVLGLCVSEFPGKHRVLRHLVRQPSVFKALNWLRAKADKPPFIQPPANETR